MVAHTSVRGLQAFKPCDPIVQFEFVLGKIVFQICYTFSPLCFLGERAGVQGFEAATLGRNPGLQPYNPISDFTVFVGSCRARHHRHFGRYLSGSHDGPFS